MNVFGLIALVAEIELAMLVIWGFLHEDRFVDFERKIARKFSFWTAQVKQYFGKETAVK